MPPLRRYMIRLRCDGRKLAGVLEDARTGAESPFGSAGELVSLLCNSGLSSLPKRAAKKQLTHQHPGHPRQSKVPGKQKGG